MIWLHRGQRCYVDILHVAVEAVQREREILDAVFHCFNTLLFGQFVDDSYSFFSLAYGHEENSINVPSLEVTSL